MSVLALEKFTCGYLFQIVLEIIWLSIQIQRIVYSFTAIIHINLYVTTGLKNNFFVQ